MEKEIDGGSVLRLKPSQQSNEENSLEPQPKNVIKVVGICGSIRKNSYTYKVVELALRGAAEMGVATQLIDLNQYELGFCTADDKDYPADVFRLRKDVGEAQGIILGTPEYHGSFSGVLKNALDLMSFDEFSQKVIGLVSVSAGAMGAMNALTSLRTVGRTLHAWVVPQQVAIPNVYKVFGPDGEISDPKLKTRVLEVGQQVARYSFLHHDKDVKQMLIQWEEASRIKKT